MCDWLDEMHKTIPRKEGAHWIGIETGSAPFYVDYKDEEGVWQKADD